jgi:hypothetical protein
MGAYALCTVSSFMQLPWSFLDVLDVLYPGPCIDSTRMGLRKMPFR